MLIDFRAQILPGVDDACPTHLVSIRRLLQAQRAGVDVLVAMPLLDLIQMPTDLFLKRCDVAAEHLELILQPGMPRVVLGTEVLWQPELERQEDLSALCIGDGWLVLRLPEGKLTDMMIASLRQLMYQVRGILIMGVDQMEYDDAQKLFAVGCKGELSFSALTHRRERALWLPSLKNGDIAALGRDPRDDTHAYHKLHKLPGKLDDTFEAVMHRAAAILQMEEK